MSNKNQRKPLSLAIGTAFATTLAASAAVHADQNPFGFSDLSSGYMVADHHLKGEAKAGEGKCGGKAEAAAKAKEGQCGGQAKAADKAKEGQCGGQKTTTEGKCGEGKCGAAK